MTKTTTTPPYTAPSVIRDRVPAWLAARASKTGLNHWLRRRWCDHWGTSVWMDYSGMGDVGAGGEVFVSEPYPLNQRDLEEITEFCVIFDLSVRVTAASHHAPTACLRLEFSQAGELPGGPDGQTVPL